MLIPGKNSLTAKERRELLRVEGERLRSIKRKVRIQLSAEAAQAGRLHPPRIDYGLGTFEDILTRASYPPATSEPDYPKAFGTVRQVANDLAGRFIQPIVGRKIAGELARPRFVTRTKQEKDGTRYPTGAVVYRLK